MSEQSTVKHTAGEWFAKGKQVRYRLPGFSTSELLAQCDTEANAELIVREHNSFDQMLSALKAAEGRLVNCIPIGEPTNALHLVRAAISAAEPKKVGKP